MEYFLRGGAAAAAAAVPGTVFRFPVIMFPSTRVHDAALTKGRAANEDAFVPERKPKGRRYSHTGFQHDQEVQRPAGMPGHQQTAVLNRASRSHRCDCVWGRVLQVCENVRTYVRSARNMQDCVDMRRCTDTAADTPRGNTWKRRHRRESKRSKTRETRQDSLHARTGSRKSLKTVRRCSEFYTTGTR